MMSVRLLLVALWAIFILVVGASRSFCGDLSNLTVYLGDEKLSIPKEYIRNGVDSEHVSDIWLPLFLPDLTPAQTNLPLFNQPGWNNKITVMFEGNHQVTSPQRAVDQILSMSHMDPANYTTLPNSCRLYTGKMIFARNLYLCHLPDHLLAVECNGREDYKFPSCTVYGNLDKKTAVTYHYGIEHEGDIIQIDEKIRKLYASFASVQ